MFKLFFLAAVLALAAAAPAPAPAPTPGAAILSAPLITSYNTPLVSAPFTYSAYSAPLAYSALAPYSYALPYAYKTGYYV